MKIPSRDVSAKPLRYFGTLGLGEQPLIQFLIQELKDNSVFYDVGASYGFYSLLAAEIVTKGTVHSFEPNEEVFRYLEQNLPAPNVVKNKLALSAVNGQITFYDALKTNDSAISTAMRSVAEQDLQRYRQVRVMGASLDRYVAASNRPPTIMKIDVEGGELDVIEGGQSTLKRYRPVICMEVWAAANGRQFSMPAVRRLCSLGYGCYAIGAHGESVPADADQLPDMDERNFVFLPH